MKENQPYIPADQSIPELTVKAVLLGAVLSMVLAGANAYLGLFAGMTVSASIPAAVISMGFLKLFRNSTILENNLVQTAASAGESLAAGVIFTLPALILMNAWNEFSFFETTMIALSGGILGVLFTVPLRSALIKKQRLQFPEGVATSEVLKTGSEGGSSVMALASAAVIGGFFKLAESGLKLWHGIFDKAALVGGNKFLYFGLNLSPALMSVGYIIGLRISFLVFFGGAISWWMAIPTYIAINDLTTTGSAVDLGYQIWSEQIRYLGVGAMIVGGVWALFSIRNVLVSAFTDGVQALKEKKPAHQILRTDLDAPLSWVIIGIGVLTVPIFMIYYTEIEKVQISLFMTLFMIVAGFLFSSVAGYMAGLVGSSNNPISGITIATILTASLILVVLLGTDSANGASAAILIGAVVCCAAAIAGDNMQDLKAGEVLGATPMKQQIMQMVGVISGAVAIGPVLNLLNTAYGFGPKTPENPSSLAAPQATLMQSVAEGVFGGNLPWGMISIGAVIGVLIILIDLYQEKKKSSFRVPVLAVAIGIYLPFELNSAIMLGGILAWIISSYQKRHQHSDLATHEKAKSKSDRSGLLVASGLITGEALMGIGLAIPVALAGRSDVLAIANSPMGAWPGVLGMAAVAIWLVWLAQKSYKNWGE